MNRTELVEKLWEKNFDLCILEDQYKQLQEGFEEDQDAVKKGANPDETLEWQIELLSEDISDLQFDILDIVEKIAGSIHPTGEVVISK